MRIAALGLAAILGLSVGTAVSAAEPDPASVQAPIQGASVLGDKGRSGPDGWAWAPVTRDQSASGKAQGETAANVNSAPNAHASNDAGKSLPPGQDPGTPAATSASGPGVLDGSASLRRP